MTAQRGRRPEPPGISGPPSRTQDVESMIRVDHAGEYGAVRIYQGQLAVLGPRRHARTATEAIRKMARQEQDHLHAFEELIRERRVRPTMLVPLWHVAGYALGVATALMGENAAMACTAAVEDVIDRHYAGQVAHLDDDPPLQTRIEAFRKDEAAHRDEALARGAEQMLGYSLLSGAIKAGCRMAIALSQRL